MAELRHRTLVLLLVAAATAVRVVTASSRAAMVATVAMAILAATEVTAAALRPVMVAEVATVATAMAAGPVRLMAAMVATEVAPTAMATQVMVVLVATAIAVRSAAEKAEKAAREVTAWDLAMLATEETAATVAMTLNLRGAMAATAVAEATVVRAAIPGRVVVAVLAEMVGGGKTAAMETMRLAAMAAMDRLEDQAVSAPLLMSSQS